MKSLLLKAPAKINYRLDVLSRRPDGYHELRMIMQQLSLYDDIEMALTGSPGITVTCGRRGVPDGPGNIAWKAADAMLRLASSSNGAIIRITKRIPVAAGLGGGSSDAATVLKGMNELLGLSLSKGELQEIGVKLGADVPFFLEAPTCRAEGIGEKLIPLANMPKAGILLVNPCVPVSTAWVYKNLQLTSGKVISKLPEFFGDVGDICSILSNDLESVTIPAHPVIGEIKDLMFAAGAAGAMMSGSGPTVFGIFENLEKAEKALPDVTKNSTWFAAAVETI